jgi:hypothetical protein
MFSMWRRKSLYSFCMKWRRKNRSKNLDWRRLSGAENLSKIILGSGAENHPYITVSLAQVLLQYILWRRNYSRGDTWRLNSVLKWRRLIIAKKFCVAPKV